MDYALQLIEDAQRPLSDQQSTAILDHVHFALAQDLEATISRRTNAPIKPSKFPRGSPPPPQVLKVPAGAKAARSRAKGVAYAGPLRWLCNRVQEFRRCIQDWDLLEFQE
eukprot:5401162-Pyramimonas_sp.AAC.1